MNSIYEYNEIDIPTADGKNCLGQCVGSTILWHKRDIVLLDQVPLAPRSPPAPPSRESSPPAPRSSAPTKAPIVELKQQPPHEVPRVIRTYEELKDGKEIADLWHKANMKQV